MEYKYIQMYMYFHWVDRLDGVLRRIGNISAI